MRRFPSWVRTLGLIAAAFAGGAATSHLAGASTQAQSPYAPLEQLARVLVLVENHYVEPAERNKIIDGAIKGMVAELDPHSAYMSSAEFAQFQEETGGTFGGVGIEVDARDEDITVIAPIEGSPAARAGVRSGDRILAIDGRPVRGERLDKLVKVMRGPPGSRVKLTIRRQGVGEPLTFDLTREQIHVTSVAAKRLERDVAYVRLKQFQDGTHEEMLRAAARVRAASKAPLAGVILDLRNNPGGLVHEAEAVADEFLSSGTIYSTRQRSKVVDEAKAHDGGAFASLPVVALVNEYSASAAELVAGALQDSGRATVVGATTFGKGSVQTIYELPGGAGVRLTTMRYYTPNGRSIQAQGIRPDIVIESAQQQALAGILREQDLEGHLPAEGSSFAGSPRAVLVEKRADAAATRGPEGDVPADPGRGSDFTLAVGYQQLLRMIPAAR
ncbi:S41 family peptidase [Sorangium cellulosum]|uniref:Peptidase S41 n=1 Tax=Sorangium cellulosum TaxID=56 RepID=A0A150Q3V3_SORCE|nr:S41 family peptidase [Sorangium cellulosum]KYF62662.1 peptidase S41 [Sorangium cellulosum]